MKLKTHIIFILVALGIGLLWVYNSGRAKLTFEFNQPVRLQIADRSFSKSSRFVTVVPYQNKTFAPLNLKSETQGATLRTLSIANRGQQRTLTPNVAVVSANWSWNLAESKMLATPIVDASTDAEAATAAITLQFHNPSKEFTPHRIRDFLFSSSLSLIGLYIVRLLLIALRNRYRKLVFQ